MIIVVDVIDFEPLGIPWQRQSEELCQELPKAETEKVLNDEGDHEHDGGDDKHCENTTYYV